MNLTSTISTHGSALLHVAAEHPYDDSWTYSIGRHRRGGPELLAFLEDRHLAAAVLNELTPSTGPLPVLTPGRPRSVRALGGARVDFRRAGLPWAHSKCVLAFEHQGVHDPTGIDVLQVVVPDVDGRLPGEDGRPAECHCCPDASREDGWLYALPVPLLDVRWCDPQQPWLADTGGLLVAAPLWADGDDFVGREELVPAVPRGASTVEVIAPPVLADWTTAGAIHRLEPTSARSGHPVLGPEVAPTPGVHLCWAINSQHPDDDAGATMDWLLHHPRLAMTLTPRWVSLTALPRDAKQVRSRMRRLERDGLVTAMPRYSEPVGDAPCNCPGCDLAAGRWS